MTETKQSATSIDVGDRLRVLREQKGLSQRALATASNLSPNALSQIERGNVSPSVSTLNQLADALGVPITAFFMKPLTTSIDVGDRLRVLREQKGLSQQALAAASNLSPNALSQIERGGVSPSVSTLNQLANALGMPITAFFGESLQPQRIVFIKADQRTRIPFSRGLMEGLGGEQFAGEVNAFYLTLETGGNSGVHPVTHKGYEFIFCLRGSLEYTVEQSVYRLEDGDSLLFAADMEHRWRNPESAVVNAIIVIMGGMPAELSM